LVVVVGPKKAASPPKGRNKKTTKTMTEHKREDLKKKKGTDKPNVPN